MSTADLRTKVMQELASPDADVRNFLALKYIALAILQLCDAVTQKQLK
jgi:hypothetical protein